MYRGQCGAIVGVTCGFMAGIMLAEFQWVTIRSQIWIIVVVLGLMACLLKTSRNRFIGLLILFVLLGQFYATIYHYKSSDSIDYRSKYISTHQVRLQGQIVSEVRYSQALNATRTSFELRVQKIWQNERFRKTGGKVLVQIFKPVDLNYGDVIEIQGKLHRPFEFSSESNFSYREYLSRRNIFFVISVKKSTPVQRLGRSGGWFVLKRTALNLRRGMIRNLEVYLTPNETAMMQAILLGERTQIPNHIRDIFVHTGTAHILAISGLHVGMIALLMLLLLNVVRVPRGLQLVITILFLGGYIVLTGSRPSVVRAATMYIIFLGARLLERETNQLNMLSVAAFIILLINPLNLFDIGFQLSFTCVLGIVSLAPKIRSMLYRKNTSRARHDVLYAGFIQSFSVSVAVWLVVEGLIGYYFEIITPVSIVANLIVVPLLMVVVYIGVGLIIFALILPILAFFCAACLKVALNVMVGIAFLFSQLPFAYFECTSITPWNLTVYYLIIVMIFYFPWGIISNKKS